MSSKAIKKSLSLLCCTLALFCGCKDNAVNTANTTQKETADEDDGSVEFVVKGVNPTEKTNKFNMSIAGDYIIYDTMYNYANGLYGSDTYNFKPMVKNLKQFTEKCEVNYYNQETILAGDELPVSSYPMFVSPTEAGDAMVNIGYNLVSTSTNHSLDGGEDGVLAQYKYWQKQKDVLT